MHVAVALTLSATLLTGCIAPGQSNVQVPMALPSQGPMLGPPVQFKPAPILAKLDIGGARSLFIAGRPASTGYRSQSFQLTELFRADADGVVRPVVALDASGSPIPALQPSLVTAVDPDYLYLAAGSAQYLVRRSDGRSAVIESAPLGYTPSENTSPASGDGRGSVYYVHDQVLKHLKLPTSPDQDVLVKTAMTDKRFEICLGSPRVDAQGNVLVSMSPDMRGPYVLRIYKAGGGLHNLFAANIDTSWVDPQGRFYVVSALSGPQGLYQTTVSETGDVVMEPVLGVAGRTDSSDLGFWGAINLREGSVSRYGRSNSLVFFKDLTITKVDLSHLDVVDKLYADGEAVIALGTDSWGDSLLVRYDPTTGDERLLFRHDDYQILKVASAPSGGLVVSLLDRRDNRYSVGTLTSGGELSLLNGSIPPVQEILPLK